MSVSPSGPLQLVHLGPGDAEASGFKVRPQFPFRAFNAKHFPNTVVLAKVKELLSLRGGDEDSKAPPYGTEDHSIQHLESCCQRHAGTENVCYPIKLSPSFVDQGFKDALLCAWGDS